MAIAQHRFDEVGGTTKVDHHGPAPGFHTPPNMRVCQNDTVPVLGRIGFLSISAITWEEAYREGRINCW